MIWYYILTLAAQAIEGFAGFGSTAMALPFLASALGTTDAVALLSLNSLVSAAVIFSINVKKVNWREYAKIILPLLPFLPLGTLLFGALAQYEPILKLILGLTIVYAGARGAWYSFIRRTEPPALSRGAQVAALLTGSLVQGMFSAGGPILAFYANERLQDKSAFRATMSAVWLTANTSSLVLRLLLLNMYTRTHFIAFARCLPVLAAGIALGMLLHERIDNANFRRVVHVIMLAGGLVSVCFSLIALVG